MVELSLCRGELLNCYDAEANTNEICFHPESSDIFIAAESSFGQVTLFDMRTPTGITTIIHYCN